MDRAAWVAEHRVRLLEQAVDAKNLSYSPYRYGHGIDASVFRVGAALLLDDGTIVQGANVENASYGAYICPYTRFLYLCRAFGDLPEDGRC